MTKNLTALILILLFIGIAIFGVMGMNWHMVGANGGSLCPFSFLGNNDCSPDAVLSVIHHISTFQIFSYAKPAFLAFFLTLLLLAVYMVASRFNPGFILNPPVQLLYLHSKKENWSIHIERIRRWLSLFELSPSA